MTLLETETRETKGRLPSPTVLLRQVHAELMQNVPRAETGEGWTRRMDGWRGGGRRIGGKERRGDFEAASTLNAGFPKNKTSKCVVVMP